MCCFLTCNGVVMSFEMSLYMNRKNNRRNLNFLCRFMFVVGLIVFSLPSVAAITKVQAKVEFVAPIELIKVKDLNFGVISTRFNKSDTNIMTVSTSSKPTYAGSDVYQIPNNVVEAAEILISAAEGAPMVIEATNLGQTGNYTLANLTCSYEGGPEVPCSGVQMQVLEDEVKSDGVLFIGGQIISKASNSEEVGADNTSFDVEINYM